jgi:DNA end-binding protein Ku
MFKTYSIAFLACSFWQDRNRLSCDSGGKSETQMAKQLIQSMTSEWKPEQYSDQYHEALEKIIEEKIKHGDEETPVPVKKKKPTKIVDLASVLRQSIQQTQAKPKSKDSTKTRSSRRKKAA